MPAQGKSRVTAQEKDTPEGSSQSSTDVGVLKDKLEEDARFNPPAPSKWKRAMLILAVFALFWLAFSMRARLNRQSKVVYANRYSKEYKYRPAASPIITEILKDGRTRLRGALPTTQ